VKKMSFFRNKNTTLAILILSGFTIAIITFSIVRAQAGKTPPLPPITITPNPFASEIYRTPTPDLYGVQLSTPQGPTDTPIFPSSTIDLSPEIDRGAKFDVYVQHPDGSLTLFLIGPAPSGYQGSNPLPEEILQNLPLKEGDDILYWLPPSPWRRMEPPTITMEPYSSTSTDVYLSPMPTLNPYPQP
jgi:hypothetical protein